MPRYVGLLRAVNLAGKTKVGMQALRAMAEELGFSGVRTLLQSGNLIFEGKQRAPDALERALEAAGEAAFGFHTHYMVRTKDEWADIVARNPFPDWAERDPAHLVMMALKRAPTRQQVDALRAAIRGRETVEASGRQAYVVYPDGIGTSKLTSTVIEKHLGTPATGRNWNTVLKIHALLELPA